MSAKLQTLNPQKTHLHPPVAFPVLPLVRSIEIILPMWRKLQIIVLNQQVSPFFF